MSNEIDTTTTIDAAASIDAVRSSGRVKSVSKSLFNWFAGLAILFALWWLGGYLIEINPNTTNFKDFGPIPTFKAIPDLLFEGKIQAAVMSSGYRLGIGLLIAIICGVPIGILLGRSQVFRELSNSPFQLIRMISHFGLASNAFLTWS